MTTPRQPRNELREPLMDFARALARAAFAADHPDDSVTNKVAHNDQHEAARRS